MSHPWRDRAAIPIDDVLNEIRGQAGRRFDPLLAERFIVLINRLRSQHGPNLDTVLGEAGVAFPYNVARQTITAALAKHD